MRLAPSIVTPQLLVVFAALALSAGCGAKGDDDEGTAGTGGTGATGSGGSGGSGGKAAVQQTVVWGFDSGIEGFSFQDYEPGDAMYVNVFAGADKATLRTQSLTWDEGQGADGMGGRLKLEIPFTDWNQLADIQINLMGELLGQPVPADWSGKILHADIMLESGGSPNASYPSGSYPFVKTGPDYVWAKGSDTNLGPTTFGLWQKLSFAIDTPNQVDTSDGKMHDEAAVVAVGLQVFSGGGSGEPKPTSATIYVDRFTLEDAP